MSTESIDIQKYLWQNIRLGEGTFAHMHTRFFVTGVSTQIRDQPNHLYDINTEHILGVIFAYTCRSEDAVLVEEQVDSSGHVGLYDPRPSGNMHVSTALMDILYNTGVKVTELGRDVFTIPLDSNISVGTDSDNGTVFDECYHFASYIFKNNTIYKLDGDAPGPILVKRLDDQDWIPWLSAHLEEKIRQEELNAYCAAIMKEPNYDEMIKISEAKIRHLEQLVISEKDVLVETKRRRRESMKQGANDASMGDPQGDTVYSRMPSDQAMYRTTVQDDDE